MLNISLQPIQWIQKYRYKLNRHSLRVLTLVVILLALGYVFKSKRVIEDEEDQK